MLGINTVCGGRIGGQRDERAAKCQGFVLFSFLLGTAKGTGLISDVTEGLTWEYEPK